MLLLETLSLLQTLRFAYRLPRFNTSQRLKIHCFLKLVNEEAAIRVTKGVSASADQLRQQLRLLHINAQKLDGLGRGAYPPVKGGRAGPPTSLRVERRPHVRHSLALETAAEHGWGFHGNSP